MEPLIGVNFAHFAPYGSGQLNGENLLSGTFGSATLDGVSDYYSQLTYKVESALFSKIKQGTQSLFLLRYDGLILLVLCWFLQQSNLSNPPTPPASLPPTPPPVNRQKMINGFATTEELANKAAALGRPLDVTSHKPLCTYCQFFLSGNELLEGAVEGGASHGQMNKKLCLSSWMGLASQRPIHCADKASNLICGVQVTFLIIRFCSRATLNLI